MRGLKASRPAMAAAALALLGSLGTAFWLMNREAGEGQGAGGDKRFREAAAEAGLTFRTNFLAGEQGEKFKINLYDHGSGVAAGDYDGDGRDDIYFVNQLGRNALYRNKGDGTFEDKTEEAGVALGDRICVSATFVDYDNDGRQDLFVTSTRGGNVLFHNEGNGRFRDVTTAAGLHHVGHSNSAHFFDFDNDGRLDLLVTNTAKWTHAALEPKQHYYPGKSTYFETAGSAIEYNLLYHNDGKGKFTDVTEASGLKGLGWAADAAVFDYDGNGFLDILITNMFGRSQLYRNQGDGHFVEVTLQVLGRTSWGGMGAHAFDFNNDGKLDLFIVDMHSDMHVDYKADLSTVREKAKYRYSGGPFDENHPGFAKFLETQRAFGDLVPFHYDEVLFGNTFFKNLGGGKFMEMSDRANLETFWPWGIACGDFDNNGYEDVFIPAGMGYPFEYWPSSLMMNEGKEVFTNRAREDGIEPPRNGVYQDEKIGGSLATRSSRSAATADFDGDGRVDIVVNNFNDRPYYFRNRGRGGHYLALRLTGTRSNRDAIGAVVRLYTGDEIMTRQVNCACGYLAQSSKVIHFGLGERTRIDKIDITWPGNHVQSIPPPELNKLHSVTEAWD